MRIAQGPAIHKRLGIGQQARNKKNRRGYPAVFFFLLLLCFPGDEDEEDNDALEEDLVAGWGRSIVIDGLVFLDKAG